MAGASAKLSWRWVGRRPGLFFAVAVASPAWLDCSMAALWLLLGRFQTVSRQCRLAVMISSAAGGSFFRQGFRRSGSRQFGSQRPLDQCQFGSACEPSKEPPGARSAAWLSGGMSVGCHMGRRPAGQCRRNSFLCSATARLPAVTAVSGGHCLPEPSSARSSLPPASSKSLLPWAESIGLVQHND